MTNGKNTIRTRRAIYVPDLREEGAAREKLYMKENAIITVYGQQITDGQEDEPIQLVTTGSFIKKDDVYMITYMESEITGLDDTITVIEAAPDRVVISREGKHSSQLIFEHGKRHVTAYDADVMSLTMSLYTRSVKTELSESGGRIEAVYSVDLEGFATTKNIFKLEVKLMQ